MSSEAETPLLEEFATLWARGLADAAKLWQLFDLSEMYLVRPDYFGAPVFQTRGQLVTPVFSTVDRLTEFVETSAEVGPASGAEGFDWVRISGVKLFGLPVRARWLAIDAGSEHEVLVDLASREDPPPIANGAPPIAINLQISADGTITSEPRSEPSPLPDQEQE